MQVVKNGLLPAGGTAPIMLVNQTDEQLVARMMAGETDALETVYDRYAPGVMGLALRIVGDRAAAEDLVQETFWRVWKHCAAFRRERGTFAGWLFAIARNAAIDRLRRSQNVRTVPLDPEGEGRFPFDLPDPDADVPESAFLAIQRRRVRAALGQLPEEQGRVIELAYLQGLTRQEIAERLRVPLGTVHTRARLALQKLRTLLADAGFED
jgi:RNA polymerase sigma-70 factor (ECF subfamily)